MNQISILIVDDHLDARFALEHRVRDLFTDTKHELVNIQTASSITELYALVSEQEFHVILLDRDLGRDNNNEMIDGIQHIESILEIRPKSRIYIYTSYEDFSLANIARDNGAKGYLTKNSCEENQKFNDGQIKQAVKDAKLEIELERMKAMLESHPSSQMKTKEYVCQSDAMKRIEGNLKSLAEIKAPVLITGETGLGKTYTAKRLHQLTEEYLNEKNRIFLYKDINTISPNLQVSELFGHEKGSFTGANQRKLGLFELAGDGTLFLDEIGDATAELQGALLNVIEEKRFRRLGGNQELKFNGRLIFATNKDLEKMVLDGEFRKDLYARICAIVIKMPALNERKADIPFISEKLAREINKENNKNISFKDFPALLKQHFLEANFPDNIRGIRNDLVRLAAFCPSNKNGKVDYTGWRSILNSRQKISNRSLSLGASTGNDLGNKTLDCIVDELAQFISSEDGPGLSSAIELLEYRAIDCVAKKYKKKKEQAKVLKLRPSTFSTKLNKFFKNGEFNQI